MVKNVFITGIDHESAIGRGQQENSSEENIQLILK
jgi:hypothetical protein